MKLLLAIFLLGLSTPGFAAPRPQPPTTAVVLQDGTHAVIKNGQLLLVGPGGKQSPAPPGPYVTQDGKQLTVESNGRLSSSDSPSNPALRRNEPSPSVAPTRSDPTKGPTVAPSPVTSVNPTRSNTVKAPPPHETANDMANATKTQDAVLKALYEITTKLQAMESKQAAQLQAMEVKQTALENQMKAFQATALLNKNEIIGDIVTNSVMPSMQSEYLDYLKAINESTKGLPHADVNSGDKSHTLDFWWKIWENSKNASELAEQEFENGGW
jgi:hypothetical protein